MSFQNWVHWLFWYVLYLLAKLPPLSSLSESLRFLVNNAMFSDVKFNVDGGIIYGHKAILAVRSEYFRAMFCNGLKQGEAQVKFLFFLFSLKLNQA